MFLTPPINPHTLAAKLDYLLQSESNLSLQERSYRDARAAFKNDMRDMAEEMAKEILIKQPDDQKTLILMGDIFLQKEEAESAQAYFKTALTLNPKSAVAAHRLAQTLMQKKMSFLRLPRFSENSQKLIPSI